MYGKGDRVADMGHALACLCDVDEACTRGVRSIKIHILLHYRTARVTARRLDVGARAVVRDHVTHDSNPVFGRNSIFPPGFSVALLTERGSHINVRIDRVSVRVFCHDQYLKRESWLHDV